jgi:hypothetical protein
LSLALHHCSHAFHKLLLSYLASSAGRLKDSRCDSGIQYQAKTHEEGLSLSATALLELASASDLASALDLEMDLLSSSASTVMVLALELVKATGLLSFCAMDVVQVWALELVLGAEMASEKGVEMASE